MLCEKCKKNEAAYHITKIVDNSKQELNLCEKCAKDLGELNFMGNLDMSSPFSFQNIICGIMEYINQPNEIQKSYELSCTNCGTTYSEFKKTGYFGCSECYSSFACDIEPVIKRVQGNVRHIGKIPKRQGINIINKNEIHELKTKLQKAIEREEYEIAAEIRDKIKKIQSYK